MKYDRKKIAQELEHIAAGRGYFGNALRVAKDLPELEPEDRSVIDAFATGATVHQPNRNWGVELQDIAMKIRSAGVPSRKYLTQFNRLPIGTKLIKNGNRYIKKSTRTAWVTGPDGVARHWFYFSAKESVVITDQTLAEELFNEKLP